MWKVIIVEDEVFVRESIREIIRWEDLGFEVVGEAGNGQDALALIEQLIPDLVLTDIDMPILDGIELLKQARDKGYECRFIMLTCMDEFDYVRQAMEYGASNYILKLSMSVQTLRDTLVKASRELSSNSIAGAALTKNSYESLWNYVYEDINHPEVAEFIEKSINVYHNHLSVFAVLHGRTSFNPRQLLDGWRWNSKEYTMHAYQRMGQTSLFIYTSFKIPELTTYHTNEFPISAILNKPSGLVLATWREALRGLDSYWYGRSLQSQLSETKQFVVSGGEGDVLSWGVEKRMMQAFELEDVSACKEAIDIIWMDMQSNKVPMPIVKNSASRMVSNCLRIINRSVAHPDQLEDVVDHETLKMWVLNELERALSTKVEVLESDHPEINKILQYINQHYSKDITVKQMAEYASIGESYLSGLFKKKIGHNLIHYLHTVRIKHAQQYLIQSDFSINVIGGKVGFVNDNYFIKIFKRITNLTPSEYRKQAR